MKKIRAVMEAITRLNRAILNFLSHYINVPVLVVWYISGLTVFHTMAEFSPVNYTDQIWDRIYYVWNKAIPVMIFIIIYKHEDYSKLVQPVFFYSAIAFLWEITSWIIGINWNDNIITTSLFLLILGVTIILTIKEGPEWHQRS